MADNRRVADGALDRAPEGMRRFTMRREFDASGVSGTGVVLEGVQFAMVHETGSRDGRERRMQQAFPEVDVLVFGHSHIPWDTTAPNGLRLLNPGSPTDRRRQPAGTFLTATVEGGILSAIDLVPVG